LPTSTGSASSSKTRSALREGRPCQKLGTSCRRCRSGPMVDTVPGQHVGSVRRSARRLPLFPSVTSRARSGDSRRSTLLRLIKSWRRKSPKTTRRSRTDTPIAAFARRAGFSATQSAAANARRMESSVGTVALEQRPAVCHPGSRRDLWLGRSAHRGRNAYRRGPHGAPGSVAERLRFTLHLTGLIREDVGSAAIRQTLTLHFARGIRTRRLVQTFEFVVAAMA